MLRNFPRNFWAFIPWVRKSRKIPTKFPCEKLGSDFGRMDFSRIFFVGPPDFFADFVAGFFLLIFVGKSGQKNPPGKSPAKSSKIYTTKIPDTFLQRGWAKKNQTNSPTSFRHCRSAGRTISEFSALRVAMLHRSFAKVAMHLFFIRRHGGVEKRRGRKTSRMTPLPKRVFGPPPRTVRSPPPRSGVSALFSCAKIHDRAEQKLFWRGPTIFGRARFLVRFSLPIRFVPPYITAQL